MKRPEVHCQNIINMQINLLPSYSVKQWHWMLTNRHDSYGSTRFIIRDLKLTTTATATRTWKSKRSNNHNLRSLRNETATTSYFNFHLELNTSFIRHAEVEVWYRVRRITNAAILFSEADPSCRNSIRKRRQYLLKR